MTQVAFVTSVHESRACVVTLSSGRRRTRPVTQRAPRSYRARGGVESWRPSVKWSDEDCRTDSQCLCRGVGLRGRSFPPPLQPELVPHVISTGHFRPSTPDPSHRGAWH